MPLLRALHYSGRHHEGPPTVVGFSRRKWSDVCTGMDLAHRMLNSDFTFICFWLRHELRQL